MINLSEKELAAYLDNRDERINGRLMAHRTFRGTIKFVSRVAPGGGVLLGNAYSIMIQRTGDLVDQTTYFCSIPDYTPNVGDVVDLIWRTKKEAIVFQVVKANLYQCRAYRANALSITSNSAAVVVSFDTVDYDPNNNFDPTTTFAYTAPVTGLYAIDAHLSWGATLRTVLEVYSRPNGGAAVEVIRGTDSGATAFQRGYHASGEVIVPQGNLVDVRVAIFDNVAHVIDIGQAVTFFNIRLVNPSA